jgi:ATP-dependent RNA helicase DDX49/DBP8
MSKRRELADEASHESSGDVEPRRPPSGSESESDSDSDSLDSSEPRKRRKTSSELALVDDDEDDEDDEDEEDGGAEVAKVPSFTVPSRVKRAPLDKPGASRAVQQPRDLPATVQAPVDPNTSFESINVRPWLVKSLANMAIRRPTGIQKGCIPQILRGRDCIGGSRTGSGKTVAFAVPILQKWAEDPSGIFAVVLTPTRYVLLA